MPRPVSRRFGPPAHHGKRRAFTILEILVAAALMAGLTALVLSLVAAVLDRWAVSSGRMAARDQARLVLDLLEGDLQTALFEAEGGPFLTADWKTTDDVRWVDLRLLGAVSEDLAVVPGGSGPTPYPVHLTALGWWWAKINPITGQAGGDVLALFRGMAGSRATFDKILGQPGALDTEAAQLTGAQPLEALLSDKVIGLEMSFYLRREGQPPVELREAAQTPNRLSFPLTVTIDGAERIVQRPDYVDLRVDFLSEEGERRWRAWEAGEGTEGEDQAAIFEQYRLSFFRRVAMVVQTGQERAAAPGP